MNLQDYRVDIEGQDWSANRRFDGDYIKWSYVEPIVKQHAQMLSVLKEIEESAEYWSDGALRLATYDVPIGIHERINNAIAAAEGREG